jgi:hypothetical protein
MDEMWAERGISRLFFNSVPTDIDAFVPLLHELEEPLLVKVGVLGPYGCFNVFTGGVTDATSGNFEKREVCWRMSPGCLRMGSGRNWLRIPFSGGFFLSAVLILYFYCPFLVRNDEYVTAVLYHISSLSWRTVLACVLTQLLHGSICSCHVPQLFCA